MTHLMHLFNANQDISLDSFGGYGAVAGCSFCLLLHFLYFTLSIFSSPLPFSAFRVSSAGPSRRTSTPLTRVNTKAAASSTRSPATSASCAALRSASLWAWPWTVSYSKLMHSTKYLQRYPQGEGCDCRYATVENLFEAQSDREIFLAMPGTWLYSRSVHFGPDIHSA